MAARIRGRIGTVAIGIDDFRYLLGFEGGRSVFIIL